MGRIVLHVDILEILSLAWDHPLVTGGLVLMFTPPLFPVVVFFSPLLISTALCAVALISVGHQIEATRERELAEWNARVLDRDIVPARTSLRRRSRVPGVPGDDERWLDWVQGYEPGSSVNTFESTLLNDMKEEGLKVEFRADEGGIEFLEEDFLDRQIAAFREYERSFSYRNSARSGADLPALSPSVVENGSLSMFSPSMEMITIPNEGSNFPTRQIPPMFLYNLKTGGTGTKKNLNSTLENFNPTQENFNSTQENSNPSQENFNPPQAEFARGRERTFAGPGSGTTATLPFGSFDISGMVNPVKGERDEQHRGFFEETGNFAKFAPETQASPAADLNTAAWRNVSLQNPLRHDHSLRMDSTGFDSIAATQPSPFVPLTNLNNVPQSNVSRQSKISREYSLEMDFAGFNITGAETPETPVITKNQSNVIGKGGMSRERSMTHDQSSDFTGFDNTAAESRVSYPTILNWDNGGKHNASRPIPTTPDYTPDFAAAERAWDFGAPKMNGHGGNDSHGSSVHLSPSKSRSIAPANSSQEGKSLTYNASLRVGNAVIYNASSECARDPTMELEGHSKYLRNEPSNRDRRMSTSRQKRKHLARERSSKHPFQLGFRDADEWKPMSFPNADK